MTAKEAYDLVISGEYVSDRKTYDELKRVAAGALVKQIAKPFENEKGVHRMFYKCGECNALLAVRYDNYCPRCGQMVDWSGKE